MPVYDLFFKRQKRLSTDVPDVFVYDEIPRGLRIQIVQIMHDALGDQDEYQSNYRAIADALRREVAVFALPPSDPHDNDLVQVSDFLLNAEPHHFLSVVEIICLRMENASKHNRSTRNNNAPAPDGIIQEINIRFRENGVGYEYVKGEIIRVDSQLLHAEAVVPALTLLHDKHYKGAEQEFRGAFDHFRKGNNKEAMVDALKSFESVMKVICATRSWEHDPKSDSAAKLLTVCLNKGLVPTFWQNHMNALRTTLEAGVPTGRNKMAGHGQGVAPVDVPDHLVSYVLHMTASAIVFLVKSEQALP
jgi:hypothetical protein